MMLMLEMTLNTTDYWAMMMMIRNMSDVVILMIM